MLRIAPEEHSCERGALGAAFCVGAQGVIAGESEAIQLNRRNWVALLRNLSSDPPKGGTLVAPCSGSAT
jgi:hypothetical protein